MNIEWLVSSAFVRLVVLPWDPGLAQPQLREVLSRALLARQFLEDPADYQIRFLMGGADAPSLAVCIPSALIHGVTSLARSYRSRITCLTPVSMLVWRRFAHALKKHSGVLNLVEEDRLMRIVHRQGQIAAIDLQPFSVDALSSLMSAEGEAGNGLELPTLALHPGDAGAAHSADGASWWLKLASHTGRSLQDDLAAAYASCGIV